MGNGLSDNQRAPSDGGLGLVVTFKPPDLVTGRFLRFPLQAVAGMKRDGLLQIPTLVDRAPQRGRLGRLGCVGVARHPYPNRS